MPWRSRHEVSSSVPFTSEDARRPKGT